MVCCRVALSMISFCRYVSKQQQIFTYKGYCLYVNIPINYTISREYSTFTSVKLNNNTSVQLRQIID